MLARVHRDKQIYHALLNSVDLLGFFQKAVIIKFIQPLCNHAFQPGRALNDFTTITVSLLPVMVYSHAATLLFDQQAFKFVVEAKHDKGGFLYGFNHSQFISIWAIEEDNASHYSDALCI